MLRRRDRYMVLAAAPEDAAAMAALHRQAFTNPWGHGDVAKLLTQARVGA